MTDIEIRRLAERLSQALLRRGQTVTAVESCTGGWITKAITDLPGSSALIGYGLVTYSNEAKMRLVDVRETTLARHGAVSRETVLEMAKGGLRASSADWSVAVSGVAGPSGGSAEKPVGLVWFGFGGPQGDVDSESATFEGDRDAVRRAAVCFALQGLIARVERQ